MYLIKNQFGQFIPADDESHEQAKKIKVGEEVKASKARNAKFHRKAFAIINAGFQNQEKYKTLEVFRKVMTIKAGYHDTVKDKDGNPYFIPQSLSYGNMSAETFEKWYEDTAQVIARELGITAEELKEEIWV